MYPKALQRGTGEALPTLLFSLIPRLRRTHVGSCESITSFCGLTAESTGTLSVWKPMEAIHMSVVAAGECR